MNESIQALIGLIGVIIVVTIIAWPILKLRNFWASKLESNLSELSQSVGAEYSITEGYTQINIPVYFGVLYGVTEYRTGWWVPSTEVNSITKKLSVLSLKYGLATIFFPYVLIMVLVNCSVSKIILISPNIVRTLYV